MEKDDHDVVDALRRIAAEEIDGALASVAAEGEIGPRIHDIRKRMKKLRGLVRLVRPAFPDYAAENAHFRDIARSIASVRDAEVMSSTLDRLIDCHSDAIAGDAFAELSGELSAGRDAAADLAPVAEALRRARDRIGLWTLHETGWDAVAGGLAETYRRARKRRKAKTDDEFHAWRKPIKYHWYHVRLLREIWPEGMDARAEAADALGNCLGLYQDFAILDLRTRKSDLPKSSRRVLRGLIEQRKAELEEEARETAPRLLAEKPEALVARWGELWDAWRA